MGPTVHGPYLKARLQVDAGQAKVPQLKSPLGGAEMVCSPDIPHQHIAAQYEETKPGQKKLEVASREAPPLGKRLVHDTALAQAREYRQASTKPPPLKQR